MTLFIPANLRVRTSGFVPSNQSVSGGASASGFEQVLAGPGGRWKASLTFQVRTEPELLAYRAFLVALAGRSNEVLLGPRDGIRPRAPSGYRLNGRGVVPWRQGALFATGGGWSTPAVVVATAGAAAAAQTTALSLSLAGTHGVQVGHFIGLVDRVHMVMSVTTSVDGTAQNVTLWPWLRAPVAAGQAVILDKPLCRMRLASDDSGAFDKTWKDPASPKMDFVEAFDP